MGLFIILGTQYSLFIIFLTHYSLFIIKKGHYSLVIIPHPDPHVLGLQIAQQNQIVHKQN